MDLFMHTFYCEDLVEVDSLEASLLQDPAKGEKLHCSNLDQGPSVGPILYLS